MTRPQESYNLKHYHDLSSIKRDKAKDNEIDLWYTEKKGQTENPKTAIELTDMVASDDIETALTRFTELYNRMTKTGGGDYISIKKRHETEGLDKAIRQWAIVLLVLYNRHRDKFVRKGDTEGKRTIEFMGKDVRSQLVFARDSINKTQWLEEELPSKGLENILQKKSKEEAA